MKLAPRSSILLVPLCACGLALSAPAAAETCGVSGATTASIGTYNPFSSTGFNEVSITLTLNRLTQPDGGKTRSVNFFLVEPAGQTALDIRYQGRNVVHPLSQAPRLSLNSPASGTIYYNFSSPNNPDSVSLPLVISVPAGVDLTAGRLLTFDIAYICDAVAGMDRVEFRMILAQALTVKINVASALQASWAGPALNFGEIGDLDNVAASQRSVEGAVRVASSGPYKVRVSSANGYRMTYAGGSPDNPQQRINYSASFLGSIASPQSPTTLTALCSRVGLSGENLPLRVRLLEGGSDKVAAPEYKDTLTITVTPLAASYSGAVQDCP